MSKTNRELYVVYGSNYDGYFGHKYFSNKKQALGYKLLKEKTKEYSFDKYYLETISIEDESIDYSKTKLFSTLSIKFCNYNSIDNSFEEYVSERKVKYYIDDEETEYFKESKFNIIVGDYNIPEMTIKYDICIKDENNIEDIINICNTINKLILDRAIELSNKQIETNKQNDRTCEYIVSKTLKKEFNKIIAEYLSAYSFNEKEN